MDLHQRLADQINACDLSGQGRRPAKDDGSGTPPIHEGFGEVTRNTARVVAPKVMAIRSIPNLDQPAQGKVLLQMVRDFPPE